MPFHRLKYLSLLLALSGGAVPEGAFAVDPGPRVVTQGAQPSVMLRTPRAYRQAFEATMVVTRESGWLQTPAWVSDRLFVRALEIDPVTAKDPLAGDREHVLNTYALNRAGIGRWFTFVGDHQLLEKALVDGQFAASKVFEDIGYGPGFQCKPHRFYWLVVFQQNESVRPLPGVYANLPKWFSHVYRGAAPTIEPTVLETLKSQRFTQVTGCPVDAQGYFDSWNPLQLGQCKEAFRQTVTALRANTQCPNQQTLKYRRQLACPTDAVLQSFGKQPDDLQLRGYLFASGGFNEFYTGYGYTANAYNQPIAREYWTDNAWLRNLPNVELLRVQCGDAKPAAATTANGEDPYPRPRSALIEQY